MASTILITGAAGEVGTAITPGLSRRHNLILSDMRRPADCYGLPFVEGDITNLDKMRALVHGVDTVIHLAANREMTAPWVSLLPNNLIGAYNLFQAAYEAGCRRVIFASTINTVTGYPMDVQVHPDMPVRPPNIYGASKAWGEALARYYADQCGMSMICLRLGWVIERSNPAINLDNEHLNMMLTYEDLTRLMIASVEAPASLRFGIFHGISNNRWKRLDISETREKLGYHPEDDAFALAEHRAA